MHKENKDLVIWMITPPNNIKNFILEIKKRWKGTLCLICCHDIKEERKKIGYNCDGLTVDKFVILDDEKNPKRFAHNFIKENSEAIHCFFGIYNEPSQYMYYLKSINPSAKIAAFSEKPALSSGSFIKRMLKRICGCFYYRFANKRAMRCVDAMFVCSLRGVADFKKYGWIKNNLFDFMYPDGEPQNVKLKVKGTPVRFLYVGRFGYRMRGLDVLMESFDRIKGENWTLSLVGGYGPEKDEVILWAKNNAKVTFEGTWKADEVQKKMTEYDVYVAPSREDSWNGQINMALLAGVGVITTDQTGSDELVSASGAGTVIKSSSAEQLTNALDKVIKNEEIVNEWKKKAAEYSERITVKETADYFCKVLEYIFCEREECPECPWLKERFE